MDDTLARQILAEEATKLLLSCPFCGDAAATCEGDGKWFVGCCNMECFCVVGEGYDPSAMPNHVFTYEDDAIAAWNTRFASLQSRAPEGAPTDAEIEAVLDTEEEKRKLEQSNWAVTEGALYATVRHFAAPNTRAETVEEWQDISTAPRDGTWVVLLIPESCQDADRPKPWIETARWVPEKVGRWEHTSQTEQTLVDYDESHWSCYEDPTHWKPLPAIRALSNQKGEKT